MKNPKQSPEPEEQQVRENSIEEFEYLLEYLGPLQMEHTLKSYLILALKNRIAELHFKSWLKLGTK